MTVAASMRVKHRKSPGAHARWSHGRHGKSSISTDSVVSRGSRQGLDRTDSVGP
jgi:hypothetical protein